ncbi:MAG: efflux RND transporter periplasmic adaptor subunit [Treponema sp.]|nr:efflux RND transporter periplasmic adaptor subunit [Treponema sp.]
MRRFPPPIIFLAGLSLASPFLFSACVAAKTETAQKSMEQIHAEEGMPVKVRRLALEPFSVYLQYPATLNARSEATASASLPEVVREIHGAVGDLVRRHEVIVQFSQDNANYQQATVALESAKAAYERFKTMFDNSAVSPQDFDAVKVQYAQAQAGFKTIDDMINVKAPIDGYLTQLDVQVSDNVNPGTPLFTVSKLDAIEAKLWVGANEIRQIKTGQTAVVHDMGTPLRGTVTQVALVMDARQMAFPVTATFADPRFALAGGGSADISVEVYRSEAIVAHLNELVQEGGKYYAFVVENGVARRRELSLGRRSDLSYEILGGLRSGDELVTQGAQGLSDGMKVQIAGRE